MNLIILFMLPLSLATPVSVKHWDMDAAMASKGLSYAEQVLVFSLQGLVNQLGAPPVLSVDAGYLDFDWHNANPWWRGQLEQRGTASFINITDTTVCGLVAGLDLAPPLVNGVVLYTSATPVGNGYTMPMALTLASQQRLLPVTPEILSAHPCLAKLPVKVDMRIGKMPQMASRETAWRWAVDVLLPKSSTTVVFNIYHFWSGKGPAGYKSDPQSNATVGNLDYAVQHNAFILDLDPDVDAALMAEILGSSHLQPMFDAFGWHYDENRWVAQVTKGGGTVYCSFASPNLSFWALLKAPGASGKARKLPSGDSGSAIDHTKYYVIFETNEGDTPRIVLSAFGSAWASPHRGTIPVAWAVDALLSERFPAMMDFYAATATSNDSFIGGVAGAGYVHLGALSESHLEAYATRAGRLFEEYMPENAPADTFGWANWSSLEKYKAYAAKAGQAPAAFVAQPLTGSQGYMKCPVLNQNAADGTPLICTADQGLGNQSFDDDCGHWPSLLYRNRGIWSADPGADLAARIRAIAGKYEPPFFITVYGGLKWTAGGQDPRQEFFTLMHSTMEELGSEQFKAIGASEMARLAKDSCPHHKQQNVNVSPPSTRGQDDSADEVDQWATCAVPCRKPGAPSCAGVSILAEWCSTLPGTNTSGLPFALHKQTRCFNSFSDSTATATVGQCEALCKDTKHCDVFTFNAAWAGTHWCWLYTGTHRSHACETGTKSAGFVSGWRGGSTAPINASSCAKAGCCYQAQPLGPNKLKCVNPMAPSCAPPPPRAAGQQPSGSQLQLQLDAAVAAKAPSFALPKNCGVRFARGEGLLLSRAANMAIVGENTTLWFQPGGGLRVLRCANITISGVIIDYDPLPYVQAEILAMAPVSAPAAAAAAAAAAEAAAAEAAAAAAAAGAGAGAPGAAPSLPVPAARRTLPAAALAPCLSRPPAPAAGRPVPPCPHGWWQPPGQTKLCDQGCPSASQARNASTGQCLCGQAAPNDNCLVGETCVDGQCSGGPLLLPRGEGEDGEEEEAAPKALAWQLWRLDVPFKGFVSNAASKSCLNVDDCATDLIYDGCPAAESKDETTCAGKGNYSIFQFVLELADGNASHQQLRSVFGDNSCVAAVAQPGKCDGCSGDPCTRRGPHGETVPCEQPACSASDLCAGPPPPPPKLQRRPCDPRDDSQLWSHTDLGQLRSGSHTGVSTGGTGGAGLCLTAGLPTPSPGPPPPPPPPRLKYTLRLAPRSNLFNFSCAKPNPNSSTPWASNASVCEHDGINQLFGSDRRPKIGSDFGSCAASQLPPLLCPGGVLPAVPSVGDYHMLNERDAVAVMPAMLDADGASIAQVGDFLTYSGRDWYTYTLANSSNVTTSNVTIHSSSGFTIVELDGECGHTYRRVNVVRREGYVVASNGDVFHSSDCAKGATIEDSVFEAALDDFYNVHTTVHVAWTPKALRSGNGYAAGGVDNNKNNNNNNSYNNESTASTSTAVYIIQPRETGTDESVGPEVSEYWYGTASPMSSMRPGDSLSCFTFDTKSARSVPVANLTLTAFPQPVTDEAELASAAALGLKLQANAGSNRWVSLRLWKALVRSSSSSSSSSAAGALPLAVMCDLDRYSNRGFVARRNLFRDGGHPQIGGRVKSSGALIEGNTFRNNAVLNQEVQYLQSWLEGPTHIRDVLIRNNTYENCTAKGGGPPSAQPASFFSLCGPPYCHNNTQVGNIARP